MAAKKRRGSVSWTDVEGACRKQLEAAEIPWTRETKRLLSDPGRTASYATEIREAFDALRRAVRAAESVRRVAGAALTEENASDVFLPELSQVLNVLEQHKHTKMLLSPERPPWRRPRSYSPRNPIVAACLFHFRDITAKQIACIVILLGVRAERPNATIAKTISDEAGRVRHSAPWLARSNDANDA